VRENDGSLFSFSFFSRLFFIFSKVNRWLHYLFLQFSFVEINLGQIMWNGFGHRNSEKKQNVIVASPSRFSTYTKPVSFFWATNFISLLKSKTFVVLKSYFSWQSLSIEKRLLTYQDSNCNVTPKVWSLL